MKTIVVVRHGDWCEESPERLTDDGKSEMKKLAEIISVRDPGSISILVSNRPRSLESAQILYDKIGTNGWGKAVSKIPLLNIAEFREPNGPRKRIQDAILTEIYGKIIIQEAKTVVIVTQETLCFALPPYLLTRLWQTRPLLKKRTRRMPQWDCWNLPCGGALFIDIKSLNVEFCKPIIAKTTTQVR